MEITKTLEELLAKERAERTSKGEYVRLENLMERLRATGRLRKPEYTIPLPDTIGRDMYQVYKAGDK